MMAAWRNDSAAADCAQDALTAPARYRGDLALEVLTEMPAAADDYPGVTLSKSAPRVKATKVTADRRSQLPRSRL
jgi:hypothetical protein